MKGSHNRISPAVSVIIPTHNRCNRLKRTLDALCLQTWPLQQVEVLVVADGCTDGTVPMLRHYNAPFTLRIIEQPGQGAATARNQGAAKASGRLLLFLDDDVEATPPLVEAHIRTHQRQSRQVVIGPYPSAKHNPVDFFRIQLQAWWADKFTAIGQAGHRFTYRDLLSGNLSLDADLFAAIGGFDHTIRDCGGEDYEFGIRLIKANVPITFAPDALGYHYDHETTDLNRIFRRARQEGRADVIIGRRYLELRLHLPFACVRSFGLLYRIILQPLIFGWPMAGDFLSRYLQRLLLLLERAKLQRYWQRLYSFLHFYWYWRGVADKLETWQALINFLDDDQIDLSADGPIIELNLHEGLAAAVQRLDAARPAGARVSYGRQPVGFIRPQPGAEPLRGVHLRPILANTLTVPLLEALALEGAITTSNTIDRRRLFNSIRSKSVWFGPTDVGKMWYEQYSQWNHLERDEIADEHLSNEHWEQLRKIEVERAWLEEQLSSTDWRVRLYRKLYRWHEPFHDWYTQRGWTWLSALRQTVRQMLLG